MKNQKGITLVVLVVTIVVLIILTGISINLVLGDNGIITIAKKARENTELAKIEEENELNELYAQLETGENSSDGTIYDSVAKLTEFKTAIANAIEETGGIKPEISAETVVFANNIKGIVKEVTKNATATAEDIANGKTAWINGERITGTKDMSSSGKAIATWQLCTSTAGTLTNNVVYCNDEIASNNENKITIKKDGKVSIYGCCELGNGSNNGILKIYINDIAAYTYQAKSGYEYNVYNKNNVEVKNGDIIYITTSGGIPGQQINTNSTTIIYQ